MKPLHDHVQRLAARLLQIEQANTLEEAEHAARKAEKHQRKIRKWHHRLQGLNLWGQ